MKYFCTLFIALVSLSAQAASLKLGRSITLSGESSSLLSFRTNAANELSSYCNLHAYVQHVQTGLQYTLAAGTVLPLVMQTNHGMSTDWDNGGIVYETTSLTARIQNDGYLVAICRAPVGRALLPDTNGLIELFADYLSIEK